VQRLTRLTGTIGAALLLSACATTPSPPPSPSLDTIEAELAMDIATLADDDFGGRFPGSEGEAKTQAWLAQRFGQIGLEPGAADGDWTQDFALVRRSPATEPGRVAASATRGERRVAFSQPMLGAFSAQDEANFSDVPLVGVDPDLEELVPGSLVNRALVLPASAIAKRANQLEAAEPTVLVITTEDQKTYDQSSRFFSRSRWRLENDREGMALIMISPEDSAALMETIGRNADRAPDGHGVVAYDTMLDARISQQSERIETANFIARLPGTVDGAGAVLVLAHWDHLGDECGPPDAADRLCNGAVDNASGIAVMAQAVELAAADGPFDRDVIVLGTSAEEMGLLGAEAFVADPVVPLPTIVAGLNIDTVAIAPRGEPVVILGAGETPLDYGITEVARTLGREVVPSDLQAAFLRRQDGWVFLREGVPTVMAGGTLADEEVFQAFLQGPYHGADDEVGEGLELGGAAEDAVLHAALIRYFASLRTYPGGGD